MARIQMSQDQADAMQQAVYEVRYQHPEFEDAQCRVTYSGRAMYGRQCPSMTGLSREIACVTMASVMTGSTELVDLVEWMMVHPAAQDAMGYDTVVYWPTVETEWTHLDDDDE